MLLKLLRDNLYALFSLVFTLGVGAVILAAALRMRGSLEEDVTRGLLNLGVFVLLAGV